MSETQVAERPKSELEKKQVTIRQTFDKMKAEIARALPKHVKPDFFIRTAVTQISKNPRLLECTQTSLLACALDCAALGLVPDGRRAHLIPYKDKCTLLIDYKGLLELAMNSGEVASVHADKVCFSDRFVYDKGQVLEHKIDFTKERGDEYAYYCIIKFKGDREPKCEVMTKAEVEAIRKRSQAGNSGPWVSDFSEMAKKTVFRRASKWLKLSPELREKLEKDDAPLATELEIRRPIIKDVTVPAAETFLGEPEPEVTTDATQTKTARLTSLCSEYDLSPDKALEYLVRKGMLKEGESFEEMDEEKLAGIEANGPKFVNAVRAGK